jgi:hypothetical protein
MITQSPNPAKATHLRAPLRKAATHRTSEKATAASFYVVRWDRVNTLVFRRTL